jgi:predicted metal-dependent HD superfamily phosphohydrolase
MTDKNVNAVSERLALRWQLLLQDNFAHLTIAKIQQAWSRLLSHYQEAHRYYHDFSHIEACFTWFDVVKEQLDDPLAVALAIWFHDVIYDVRRTDNEVKSAQYAVTALTNLAVSAQLVQQVYELVLLTQHSSQPNRKIKIQSGKFLSKTTNIVRVSLNDQALFLDIDLTILGQSNAIYAHYENAIRSEYQHVPLWLYKRARKRLLKRFLRQPIIYYSSYFKEKFEQQARVNIQSVLRS